MDKPIKPIAPNPSDKIKYPYPPTKEGRNYLNEPIYLPNEDFIKDYRKFQRDEIKYKEDVILYEQTKFIEDIQRSSFKLAIKKYFVTKK